MRTVTVRKNLWPFGSGPSKPKTKRSTATIGQAAKAAYAAGKKSGDTGQFRYWLESAGLADRSDTLIARLQREYDKGFEANLSSEREERTSKSVKGFTYKRHRVVATEDGWKLTGRFDDGSVFDTPQDAKNFIDSWNKANPHKSEFAKTFYLQQDMGGNYRVYVSRRGEPHQYFETANAGFTERPKQFWIKKGYLEIAPPNHES